jgi:hypothetical protein
MASTATNKQPLLVDRVFHEVQETNTLTSGSATALDILGTNESSVLVNCATNDGGIVEDLYVISRDTTAYTVLLYFSSSTDYLRPSESVFIGKLASATTAGNVTRYTDLPKVLAPLAQTGSEPQVGALYIPKGKNLWVSLQVAGPLGAATAPIVGAQGGFY